MRMSNDASQKIGPRLAKKESPLYKGVTEEPKRARPKASQSTQKTGVGRGVVRRRRAPKHRRKEHNRGGGGQEGTG